MVGEIRMHTKKSAGEWIFDTLNIAFLCGLVLAATYPFIYVLFASFSDPTGMAAHRGILFSPVGFSLSSFDAVFKNPNVMAGYGNTLIYLVAGTTLNIFLTSLGAYGLSRKNVFFKDYIMMGIAFTMLFHGGLIPSYLLVKDLHMIDSRLALILPNAISAWNLIIMRTSFAAIPDSLEESARIDGANDIVILFRIILPLSTAVIAVMVLFYGVAHWNAWFHAAIYLRTREKYPLQLILREILIQNSTDNMTTGTSADDKVPIGETIKYATIIVSTVPILCIYPLLQKYFMKGVMVGAIKG